MVSIHAPREGCDSTNQHGHYPAGCFNSRTPRGVRRDDKDCRLPTLEVSIHAPWEGCDSADGIIHQLLSVSIHAPREGCDLISPRLLLLHLRFQFTHPGRGATKRKGYLTVCNVFQFTHPGRGATLESFCICRFLSVSIHAPREGCDLIKPPYSVCVNSFNSRTPGGVRRILLLLIFLTLIVSIHAPREGCDYVPRACVPAPQAVSIHAPREGCDLILSHSIECSRCFNSRTPGGVRRVARPISLVITKVSIHAPREGCDSVVQSCVLWGG